MKVCTEKQFGLLLECDVYERDIAALSFADWESELHHKEASSVSDW
jgi:hypothetical protein